MFIENLPLKSGTVKTVPYTKTYVGCAAPVGRGDLTPPQRNVGIAPYLDIDNLLPKVYSVFTT